MVLQMQRSSLLVFTASLLSCLTPATITSLLSVYFLISNSVLPELLLTSSHNKTTSDFICSVTIIRRAGERRLLQRSIVLDELFTRRHNRARRAGEPCRQTKITHLTNVRRYSSEDVGVATTNQKVLLALSSR